MHAFPGSSAPPAQVRCEYDANRDMDVIQSEVLDIAVRTVEECKAGAELKRLWEK